MKVTLKAGLSHKLPQIIADVQANSLKVGWGENQKYEDGTAVAGIAAVHEFGNPMKNIPPRPFMRPTASEKSQQWQTLIAKGMKLVFNDKKSSAEVFEAVGLKVAGDIRTAISKVTSPSLKTATVKARLRGKKQGKSVSLTAAKPLVDSGVMLNSLTSEVSAK